MPEDSTLTITVEDILKDIDPDNVCGLDLEYDPDFTALEHSIRGRAEQQMGDTLIEAEPPNWRDIKKKTESLLTRTIDLRLLIAYLRSLIALEGFSGLETGLILLKEVIEVKWDKVYPQIDPDDDNDPTERINILLALCDTETLIRSLIQTPLIESKAMGRFNYRDITIASGRSTPTRNEVAVNQSTIDAAVQDVNIEYLQSTFQEISSSLETLNKIEALVTDFVGIGQAPSFADLRVFLKETKSFLANALDTKGVNEVDETEAENETTDQSEAVSSKVAVQKSVTGSINNNQDVIKVLNLVCEYYNKNEPSSPVPLMIERAKRLVGKSFMEVLNDIAPGGVSEAKFFSGKQDNEY
jgi:type VI secretion system protein ImpA